MTKKAIEAARKRSERREAEQPEPGNKELLAQLERIESLLKEIRDIQERQLQQ